MKNTRRFIAGFSAMTMAAAMAMSASAVDPTQIVPGADGQPTPETAGAEVTYNVEAAYTVTIPAGADISSGSDEQTITASDVLLEQGKKITVTLSKASNTASGKLFTAKDESGESTVNYTIKAGDADVAVGDKVAEFETKTGEQSATLTFTKDADSTPTFAGTHTETLTFNISVESASTPVTAITLNKTATTITAGQTETLSVSSVTPDDATDQTVTWSSDNEAVATVDADGKVTAVALGTANITATANDGSGVTATCVVTVNKVVTINQSDWGNGYSGSFTKDGVTVSAEIIDSEDGNLMGGGTFSTTLGNFTKIVVTTFSCYASGTGWSGSGSSMTWAGTPASTVSFSGEFMGRRRTQTTIVCTIEPKN